MRELLAYDYAIVRVVPRVERGECVNIGVIVSCPARDYLQARIEIDEARLRALDSDTGHRSNPPSRVQHPSHLHRRRNCGPDRQAHAARTLPLARRAPQHDHSNLTGAHGSLRRSDESARSPAEQLVRPVGV